MESILLKTQRVSTPYRTYNQILRSIIKNNTRKLKKQLTAYKNLQTFVYQLIMIIQTNTQIHKGKRGKK